MHKLYKITPDKKEYWETWEDDGVHIVHWGLLGTIGQTKTIRDGIFRKAEKLVEKEAKGRYQEGFSEIALEDHQNIIITYKIDGFGTAQDLEKRHKLEDMLNNFLGWTGLGFCDGGSTGSNSMETFCIVVDQEIALEAITAKLDGTEFSNFESIMSVPIE